MFDLVAHDAYLHISLMLNSEKVKTYFDNAWPQRNSSNAGEYYASIDNNNDILVMKSIFVYLDFGSIMFILFVIQLIEINHFSYYGI